jgi:hypothetical protein
LLDCSFKTKFVVKSGFEFRREFQVVPLISGEEHVNVLPDIEAVENTNEMRKMKKEEFVEKN